MARYALIAVLVLLTAAPGWAVQDAKHASNLPSPFPTYVWLDAFGEEPAEYSYWETGRTYWRGDWAYTNWRGELELPERGSCCPSVLREVTGPGLQSVTFRFYDDKDKLIKSVSKCAVVDAYGLASPGDEHPDYWRFSPGYSSYPYWRYRDDNNDKDSKQSLYECPWPKVELSKRIRGGGPWTIECTVGANMPQEYFLNYEWDLNHDGSFNRTTGRRPSLTCDLTKPGRYIFTVRATDMRGYTTTADLEFTVQ